ncbi:MAG: Hsp20/alpha crystallin family protein [Pirellulales bacterium]
MLARWESVDLRNELARIQNEMQRVFGRSPWTRLAEPASGPAAGPAVNLWEDADAVYVESELPGLDAGDVELFVAGRQLTIQGERQAPTVDKGVWHRQERGFGKFRREVELPTDVDAGAVEAEFKLGVLLVRLPKRIDLRPRKIVVKSS